MLATSPLPVVLKTGFNAECAGLLALQYPIHKVPQTKPHVYWKTVAKFKSQLRSLKQSFGQKQVDNASTKKYEFIVKDE